MALVSLIEVGCCDSEPQWDSDSESICIVFPYVMHILPIIEGGEETEMLHGTSQNVDSSIGSWANQTGIFSKSVKLF